jgi:hypothetical protein
MSVLLAMPVQENEQASCQLADAGQATEKPH